MYTPQKNRERLKELVGYTEYVRGSNYWREGRVNAYAEHPTDDGWQFSCMVRGTHYYQVSGLFEEDRMAIHCNCPAFNTRTGCKHSVAAMLACIERHKGPVVPVSDGSIKSMLSQYGSIEPEDEKKEEVSVAQPQGIEPGSCSLMPRLFTDHYGNYVNVSFRIGVKRMYAVKNIEELVQRFDKGVNYAYGVGLTLPHREEVLDEASQKRLAFIRSHLTRFKQVFSAYRQTYGSYNTPNESIRLAGAEWDEFFEMEVGNTVDAPTRNDQSRKQKLIDGDPSFTMKVFQKEGQILLRMQETIPDYLENEDKFYIFDYYTIHRTSDGFAQVMRPFFEQATSEMRIADTDLPAFCSVVLPFISRYIRVEDPKGVLRGFEPDPCTACFYFDKGKDDSVTARLKFRYGDREIPVNGDFSGISRDTRLEMRAQSKLRRDTFYQYGDTYRMQQYGDQVLYLLTELLPGYQKLGEVYLSDRLSQMEFQPEVGHASLSMSDGMLTMDFDAGGFPVEELEELYQSMLLRRKYHRLKDGRFMRLNGTGAESLAETAHMLQLKPDDLAKGTVRLPAFRALYLDNALNGNESLSVRRDRVLRDMIRRFKTFSDSDDQVPESLQGVLRPYQETGFRWLKTLESCGFGGILADEMGLGKTLQLITWLTDSVEKAAGRPSLIVCPASLVLNWKDEFTKFAPNMSVRLILGTAAERAARIADPAQDTVWVTSYDLLKRDIEQYTDKEFYCCALDEGQFVKNRTTKASKSVKAINCVQRFVLTGTPIENRLSELWNLFDFLMPGYLFSHERFTERLEKPIIQSGDAEARSRLAKLVQPFLMRRLKKDVLKELPPKLNYVRRVALSEDERKLYHACAIQTLSELKGSGEKLAILAALTRLRQICCDPALCFENYSGDSSKLEACSELVTTLAENGHQILVFSQFTSMLDRIRPVLEKAGLTTFTLQGSTDKETRARLVREFNAGGAQVFLISLKAGGTGLNLTAADVVIHYDPWWNQAAQDQATDRAHRIGQKQCVQVYRLIAEDTIEERILELQQKKAALLDNVTGDGGESLLSMSKDDLLALIGEG